MRGMSACLLIAMATLSSCSSGQAKSDAAASEFQQWEYPKCVHSGTTCPSGCIAIGKLFVGPGVCGPFAEVHLDCFPADVVMSGWFCYRRLSDGLQIYT